MSDYPKIIRAQFSGKGGGKGADLVKLMIEKAMDNRPLVPIIPNVPYLVEFCEKEGITYRVVDPLLPMDGEPMDKDQNAD